MMLAYYSFTGNTKAFVKDNFNPARYLNIEDFEYLDMPYILITPTYNFGEVPDKVKEFLDRNHELCQGVISCGNRNWGELFGHAGNIIEREYGIPLLYKIEMRGNQHDVEVVENLVKEYVC